jgi:hypothetical protein
MPKQPKYKAKRITSNVGVFDSMAEYRYYIKLSTLLNAVQESERIISIERQVVFHIVVNGEKITKYIADFVIKFADGRTEIHDVKNPYLVTGSGKSTPAAQIFKIKCKLIKAIYNVEIKTIV